MMWLILFGERRLDVLMKKGRWKEGYQIPLKRLKEVEEMKELCVGWNE
jgi:hypothetical protein